MIETLLIPPVAFAFYMALIHITRRLAAPDPLRQSTAYAGGEVHPARHAAPGYRPFFVVALFFAVLHLGALMLSTSPADAAVVALLYLGGLALGLVALILG